MTKSKVLKKAKRKNLPKKKVVIEKRIEHGEEESDNDEEEMEREPNEEKIKEGGRMEEDEEGNEDEEGDGDEEGNGDEEGDGDEEGNGDEEDLPSPSNDERIKKQKMKVMKKLKLISDDGDVEDPEIKERKTGVLYFPYIPPFFTPSRMRTEMSRFGEIGRIFLQVEKRRPVAGKKKMNKKYVEGWVEFKNKSIAKRVAATLNNTPVTAKKKSAAADTLWNIKYLSRFKWVHLVEQLSFESRVEQQRMKMEIRQAKKVAEHFVEQIEKGKYLKKLEEKVLKKGGLWDEHKRDVEQRVTLKQKKHKKETTHDDLLHMIFAE